MFLGIGIEATIDRRAKAAFIFTYILSQDGLTTQILHKTSCEYIPSCFAFVQSRLVCGSGSIL